MRKKHLSHEDESRSRASKFKKGDWLQYQHTHNGFLYTHPPARVERVEWSDEWGRWLYVLKGPATKAFPTGRYTTDSTEMKKVDAPSRHAEKRSPGSKKQKFKVGDRVQYQHKVDGAIHTQGPATVKSVTWSESAGEWRYRMAGPKSAKNKTGLYTSNGAGFAIQKKKTKKK